MISHDIRNAKAHKIRRPVRMSPNNLIQRRCIFHRAWSANKHPLSRPWGILASTYFSLESDTNRNATAELSVVLDFHFAVQVVYHHTKDGRFDMFRKRIV